MDEENVKEYLMLPTLRLFHESGAKTRCIVGPVGSGKTTAATWEICYYLPMFLYERYGIKKTRWVIVRNTVDQLLDTTQKTVFEWFDFGDYQKQRKILTLIYPKEGIEVEILFRSCDNPKDVKKFKSLEVTGYWIDESIEVSEDVKRMLKNRRGRYPKKSPAKFGIETTNPPDIDHPTYYQFKWNIVPGPIPEGKTPLEDHEGFWQPPYENEANLNAGYYDDLRADYADTPDWIDMYVEGKPGVLITGKLIYNNFKKDIHISQVPIPWTGGKLYRGWDNSGNIPACVVGQIPTPQGFNVLKEFCHDKKNIIDFTNEVVVECNQRWPNAEWEEWGDPAGENEFPNSKVPGEFTSNARLMTEQCGVTPVASEQNLSARINSVDILLGRIGGMLIDPSCTRLINGFIGGYHYKEIGTSGTFQEKPNKNRFSHVQDALQYITVKVMQNPGSSKGMFIPKRNNRRVRNAA